MIDLTTLKDLSTTTQLPKNTIVIKEGDERPYSMYIVLRGNVRVVKNYGKFDQAMVATLGPGDFFGEMSLFLSKPRTASVITVDDPTILLEINYENIYEIIEQSPLLLLGILKALCSRIDELNVRVRGDSWVRKP